MSVNNYYLLDDMEKYNLDFDRKNTKVKALKKLLRNLENSILKDFL